MISFDQGAMRITLAAMRNVGVTEKAVAQQAVAAAGKVFHAKVRQNISLTDHSLQDLADMGHPYAARHGAIRIHGSGSESLATPSARVHRQSGKLLQALKSEPAPTQPGWRVGFDTSVAPHAVFVVSGTRVMLPRDVVWDTANGRLTKLEMMRAIVTVLGKKLRTQGSVRIGAGGAGSGSGV